jgi:hypothetical protein
VAACAIGSTVVFLADGSFTDLDRTRLGAFCTMAKQVPQSVCGQRTKPNLVIAYSPVTGMRGIPEHESAQDYTARRLRAGDNDQQHRLACEAITSFFGTITGVAVPLVQEAAGTTGRAQSIPASDLLASANVMAELTPVVRAITAALPARPVISPAAALKTLQWLTTDPTALSVLATPSSQVDAIISVLAVQYASAKRLAVQDWIATRPPATVNDAAQDAVLENQV